MTVRILNLSIFVFVLTGQMLPTAASPVALSSLASVDAGWSVDRLTDSHPRWRDGEIRDWKIYFGDDKGLNLHMTVSVGLLDRTTLIGRRSATDGRYQTTNPIELCGNLPSEGAFGFVPGSDKLFFTAGVATSDVCILVSDDNGANWRHAITYEDAVWVHVPTISCKNRTDCVLFYNDLNLTGWDIYASRWNGLSWCARSKKIRTLGQATITASARGKQSSRKYVAFLAGLGPAFEESYLYGELSAQNCGFGLRLGPLTTFDSGFESWVDLTDNHNMRAEGPTNSVAHSAAVGGTTWAVRGEADPSSDDHGIVVLKSLDGENFQTVGEPIFTSGYDLLWGHVSHDGRDTILFYYRMAHGDPTTYDACFRDVTRSIGEEVCPVMGVYVENAGTWRRTTIGNGPTVGAAKDGKKAILYFDNCDPVDEQCELFVARN